MTPPNPLTELAERVQALTQSSRVVDFEIQIAVFGDAIWPATDMQGRITNPNSRMSDYLATYSDVINQDDQDFNFPRYTASLDAAMTLVSEGHLWTMDSWSDYDWSVGIWFYRKGTWRISSNKNRTSKTPALALVAASLRARAASEAHHAR